MDSAFRDNPATPKEIERWRGNIAKARPYTDDDPEPCYFDWIPDPARSNATVAMELLKAAGLWTEEDERIAFGPHDEDSVSYTHLTLPTNSRV